MTAGVNLATTPVAYAPGVSTFAAASENFKQIQAKLNVIAKHLGTTVASTATQTASQGASLASILSDITVLQAEVAALEAAIGGGSYRASAPVTKYQLLYEAGNGVAAVVDVSVAASGAAPLGLATAGAATGAQVSVSGNGVTVVNTGWSWTVGPVYAGLAGALTQAPLSTAGALFLQLVGYAVAPTAVLVVLGEPVLLTGGDAAQFVTLNAAGQAALLGVYQEAPIAVTSAVAYTLTNAPAGALLMVFLDGILQLPANYSVSGTTLTFSGLTMANYLQLQAVYTYA